MLARGAADFPRNAPRFTSSRPETRGWLAGRHPPAATPPLPFRRARCARRFLWNLKPRVLVVLEPCAHPDPTLTRRFARRRRTVLRLGEAELREPSRIYERLVAGLRLRPEKRGFSLRRRLETRLLETRLGRTLCGLRTRRLDLESLAARLDHPDTILCLGNGPSCEDPRLAHLDFDALFRVNHRWLERGVFARPDVVFVGESKAVGVLRGCVFGFRTAAEEEKILDRFVLRRGPRVEHFCLGRVSDRLDPARWAARPTNGMAMLATAVLLQPRRLIVAGIDLFEHPEGSYPGAPEIANGYAPVHRRDVEVEIVRELLALHRGEVEIVSEPLRRALGMETPPRPPVARKPGFPRILHQTWKTRDLSAIEEFRLCSESWRRHHPNHEYRLWDDREGEAFVAERFGAYLDTWRSFDKNIKRLDTLRYMWMHAYGGVYADLDMECLQSLEPLADAHREYEALLFCDLESRPAAGASRPLAGANGAARCLSANPALLIARPGSGFWLQALDYARRHADLHVTECTGPFALGAVANRHAGRFGVALLDQNRLFIRKTKKDFYTSVPGNEEDPRLYARVYCATKRKPAKYLEDRKRKLVADWHGTPERYRWRNEYR